MRVLVAGGTLPGGARRMGLAAAGLALRGHEVLWSGPAGDLLETAGAETLRPAPAGLGLARHSVDVVLGGASPAPVALAAWLACARCVVLALDAPSMRDWGLIDRGARDTLHAWAVIDEADAPAVRGSLEGLDPERIALWPPGGPPDRPDATHPDTEVLERVCERALARQRGRAPRAGVFLDRDGTLVAERGYLSDPAGVELLPGAGLALHDLKAAGLPIIVISNQSGVGRGLFPLSSVYEVMARLRIRARAAGIELDGVYFCPHRPEEGCACRKPGTALLERAAEDHLLSLRASFMVGDKMLDVETGQRAGGRGVLVRTGYGRAEEGSSGVVPDHVCDGLGEASAWILEKLDADEGS